MEKIRILLAVVLSFGIFLIWDMFFIPKNQVPIQEQTNIELKQKKTVPYIPSENISDIAKEEVPVVQKSRSIMVSTPLYSVDISEDDASFIQFQLKKYKKTAAEDSPLFEMISSKNKEKNLRVGFVENNFSQLNNPVFKADLEFTNLQVTHEPLKLVFTANPYQGIIIEKIYTFYPDTYLFDLNIALKNGSGKAIKSNMFLSVSKYFSEGIDKYGFAGPSAMVNGKVERIKMSSIEDKNVYSGRIKWLALQDRYFMSSIIPIKKDESDHSNIHLSFNTDRVVENRYLESVDVESGTQHLFKYNIFFGPRSMEILKNIGYNLEDSINFGWFDFIAKPCAWLMNMIYKFIPNYGVAIIILTLITKIILFPLGTKSYKSMAEMKKIQPLVNTVREKYKNDKKKVNQEVMSLYRTYKVNPMSGCLPMILQIPIFFALYRMLLEAIELRHAPFFGWINDLSAPDRLFNFGFTIPFMEPPYGIPVLTIIMGATMLLQQKMSPPMGDPTQAKIMMFMPIIFTVIFINFSSGLVLYWLINNVLSIAQQYYITNKQITSTKKKHNY